LKEEEDDVVFQNYLKALFSGIQADSDPKNLAAVLSESLESFTGASTETATEQLHNIHRIVIIK